MSIRKRSRRNDFTFIPISFIQSQDISAEAKLVWMSVASRRQANEPDPALEIICAETELCQSSVNAAEEELNNLTDEHWQALGLPL